MNRNASALAAAITATLGTASVAQGAPFSVILNQVISYSGNGSSAGNISSSTATFDYDDVTGLLTQTGDTFNVRFTITPTTTLFRHSIEGLVIGNGAAATATSYSCTEGNFGGNVGASLCGNYNFGANFLNESTVTWGPGTAFDRTVAGDDMLLGPQQSLGAYDAFTEVDWVGTTLTLRNATCNPAAPGNASGCATTGGFNAGYTWVLEAPLQEAAVDDEDSTTRNVAKIIPVLANDSLVDPVTVSVDATGTELAADANIVVTGTNPGPAAGITVTYTPNLLANTAGPVVDTFTYTANGKTATVTVTIDNTVPNAVGGDLSAISTVGVAPAGLTGTFTAPGAGGSLGDSGTASITVDGTKGDATVSGNTITYTVTDATFFTGTDSFTYTISDPDGLGPAETSGPVTVNVNIEDASPGLNDASAETNLDTPVDVDLVFAAGNGSPAQHTFAIDTDATNGGCAANGATVTYTPDAGFTGSDSCVASITDGDGDMAQATVSVEVLDLIPVVNDASVETEIDTAVDVDLSFTPGDGTLAQHTFAIATNATNGSCTVDGAGTVTYTPNAEFTGSDSCVVSLTDVNGSQDTATVSFDVTGGSTGLREDDGGSSADWLILSLLGGSALIRRRRRS